MLVLLLACAPDPALDSSSSDACVPTASWDGWGQGFFATWCGSCHSATTADRRGAPVGLDFDTAAQVHAARAAITQATLTASTMPVGGGLSSADRTLLEAYLACVDPTATAADIDLTVPVSLDLAAVTTRIDQALAFGVPRAEALWIGYLDLLYTHGELTCPYGWALPLHEYQSSMDGCTTATGWVFAGLSIREQTIDAEGTEEVLIADGFVESPTGQWGVLAGELDWWRSAAGGEGGGVSWTQTLTGTWGWEWGAGWIAEVPGFSLYLSGEWSDERASATVDGGLSLGGAAVYLEAVTIDTERCGGVPTVGIVSVRDDDGFWYALALHEDCSGCGAVTDPTGAALGEACPDWAPWMASLAEAPQ